MSDANTKFLINLGEGLARGFLPGRTKPITDILGDLKPLEACFLLAIVVANLSEEGWNEVCSAIREKVEE